MGPGGEGPSRSPWFLQPCLVGCLKKTTFFEKYRCSGLIWFSDHGEFSGVIFIEIGVGLGGAQRALKFLCFGPYLSLWAL